MDIVVVLFAFIRGEIGDESLFDLLYWLFSFNIYSIHIIQYFKKYKLTHPDFLRFLGFLFSFASSCLQFADSSFPSLLYSHSSPLPQSMDSSCLQFFLPSLLYSRSAPLHHYSSLHFLS